MTTTPLLGAVSMGFVQVSTLLKENIVEEAGTRVLAKQQPRPFFPSQKHYTLYFWEAQLTSFTLCFNRLELPKFNWIFTETLSNITNLKIFS